MKKEKLISQFLVETQNKPLHKINIGELCKASGVSRSTFYRNYESIYDLAEELEREHVDGFLSIAAKHEKEQTSMEEYMREILGYILQEEAFFKSALSVYADQHFISLWKKIMLDDITKEYRLDQKKLKGEKKIAIEMMISGVVGAYSYWLFHQRELPLDAVLNLILRIWDFYRI